MRLAILSQYFPPEIGAPQARLSEMTQRFVEAGHEVTVLTAMPNYPTGVIQDGYGGFFKRESLYGANIIRSFIYPTQRTDFLHRLSNYFSFVVSSSIVGSYALQPPDYLLVQSPPLFLGLAGYWLSRLKRCRLIFNVSDLWPDSAVHIGVIKPQSLTYRLAKRIEALCYRKSWLVTGQSTSILTDIKQRFPNTHTFLVSNGVDINFFTPEKCTTDKRQKLQTDPDKKIVISYVGLHGLAQGLDQIVNVASTLPDDSKIQFNLIGDGAEKQKLIKLSETKNCTNISFHDPVPKHEVPALVASSDIMLVPLKTEIPGSIPSKLYEAMASAKPVIIMAKGEAAEIVKRHDCGIVVEPNHISAMKQAIETLVNQPELRQKYGENGRKAAVEYFNRDKITDQFIEYLENHL